MFLVLHGSELPRHVLVWLEFRWEQSMSHMLWKALETKSFSLRKPASARFWLCGTQSMLLVFHGPEVPRHV